MGSGTAKPAASEEGAAGEEQTRRSDQPTESAASAIGFSAPAPSVPREVSGRVLLSGSPAPTEDLPSWVPRRGFRFGRYELLGQLAAGGMAEIYLAREQSSAGGVARYVAVKVIKADSAEPNFLELFQDEGRLGLRLTHPNIAHVYEYGKEASRYFLAMEWVNGKNLSSTVRRLREEGRRLPLPIAVKVVSRVAEALDYAHHAKDERGRTMEVVHRDVSPHNVMLSYDGVVKLLDFGVAKAESRITTTQAGVVRGKFAYMSPQQCLGLPLDGRSDVFSLGTVLYELLTGEPLFDRETEFQTMKAIIDGEVPPVQTADRYVPDALAAIVERAMEKEPDDRFATAGEFHEALERFLADTGEVVPSHRIAEALKDVWDEETTNGPELLTDTPLLDHLATKASLAAAQQRSGERPKVVMPEDLRPKPRRRSVPLVLVGLLFVAGAGIAMAWRVASEEPEEAQPTAPPSGEPPSTAAPAEAVPTTAELDITTRPEGASVTVGGTLRGVSPLHLRELEAGEVNLRLELEGHEPRDETVTLSAGESRDFNHTFEPLATETPASEPRAAATPPASVAINTRPWSRVFHGGRLLGTTPIARARVPSGSVRLRLVDAQGNTHRRSVRLRPGQHQSLFYDLSE